MYVLGITNLSFVEDTYMIYLVIKIDISKLVSFTHNYLKWVSWMTFWFVVAEVTKFVIHRDPIYGLRPPHFIVTRFHNNW